MDYNHPCWPDFIIRLAGEEGCNIIINNRNDCNADYRYCRRLLKDYKDVNINETIKQFRLSGALCDCEVLTVYCGLNLGEKIAFYRKNRFEDWQWKRIK